MTNLSSFVVILTYCCLAAIGPSIIDADDKLLDIHACFSKYHKRPDLDQQTAKCCKKVGLECGVDPTAHPTKRYSCLSGTDAAPKGEKKKIDEFKKCCFLMPRADRNPAQGVTYNRSSSTPTKACEPTSVNTEKLMGVAYCQKPRKGVQPNKWNVDYEVNEITTRCCKEAGQKCAAKETKNEMISHLVCLNENVVEHDTSKGKLDYESPAGFAECCQKHGKRLLDEEVVAKAEYYTERKIQTEYTAKTDAEPQNQGLSASELVQTLICNYANAKEDTLQDATKDCCKKVQTSADLRCKDPSKSHFQDVGLQNPLYCVNGPWNQALAEANRERKEKFVSCCDEHLSSAQPQDAKAVQHFWRGKTEIVACPADMLN